ncbi:hypothetical protein [Sphingomonas bacterium]|uniref:hypothetical protein n=1 Tax=Sphingomonas bacterium TaxID=1895847 RepID=UPI0020C64106|nr:hypothetical protein [Sphingomonas bacterium]
MTGDPRIDGYDSACGREAMLRFGPDEGPVVIAALPLFEEANRTRAFVVAILRALAVRGIGGALPDLPGQGESMVALETTTLADMRAAFTAAARHACGGGGRRGYAVTIRSGAILDGDAGLAGCWQLAPQDGPAMLRELSRMRQSDSRSSQLGDDATPVAVAGNLLGPRLLAELTIAVPSGPSRIVRLSTDPAPADRKVDGAPLWRRSEPGTDAALSQILADDIADWIAACEG